MQWVGACFAAALLVLGLIVAAPAVGGKAASGLLETVCAVTGGVCPAEEGGGVASARPDPAPTLIGSSSGGAGLRARTYGAGASSAFGVKPDDPARCMGVEGGSDGAQVCLGSGSAVAFCVENAALGGRTECKATDIPLTGTTFSCGDDPQSPDPAVLLCGFRSEDESTGALLRCRATQMVGGVGTSGTCVNSNAEPALVRDRTQRPTDCVGQSDRTPLKRIDGNVDFESATVTLCADARGAVSVCTFTDVYSPATLGGLSGIDDFRALANVTPARTDYDCSTASLVAGVDEGLGLECEAAGEHTATCTVAGRTITCLALDDPDGRATYHHCQDLEKAASGAVGQGTATALPGTCAPGTTTDPRCPVIPLALDFPTSGGGVPLTQVAERCPGTGRRLPLVDKQYPGSDLTAAFCVALAAQLVQGIGTLLFVNPEGNLVQTQQTTPPFGGTLGAANLAHNALQTAFGPFVAPLIAVQPQPGLNSPGHVLVIQPDGTVDISAIEGFVPPVLPLTLATGQPFAFFAGPNGAPGVLLVSPTALPSEIAVGQALAWAHQAFPALSTDQQAMLAALVSPAALDTPSLLALLGLPNDSNTRGTIMSRRERVLTRRVKLLNELKAQLARGRPAGQAFGEFEDGFRFGS